MISKTDIKNKSTRKTNPYLVELIRLALKNEAWHGLAKMLSYPTRIKHSINLSQIEEKSEKGDTIIFPGKILSNGNLTRKIRISSVSISQQALEKLKESKSEFVPLEQEIKKNPKAEGVKIIK